MPFPQTQKVTQPREKKKDKCTVEKRKTKSGTKTIIRGNCSREKLEIAKQSDFDD